MKYRLNNTGRVLAIICAIISIIMALGPWIEIEAVSTMFGGSVKHEYSMFEISDFLKEANNYIRSDEVGAISWVIIAFVVVALIDNVATIISAATNSTSANGNATSAALFNILISVVAIIAVSVINSEISDATYGGVREMFSITIYPILLIISSVVMLIGASMKESAYDYNAPYTQRYTQPNVQPNGQPINSAGKYCEKCGSFVGTARFCGACGATIGATGHIPKSTFCSFCGVKIPEKGGFCPNCGRKSE